MEQYLPILALVILVTLFGALSFIGSLLLAPQRPTSAKEAPYECGIVPESAPSERFPVRFYLVAMAFIVLDVEIVFLYPFATIMKELGSFGLIAMGAFLVVLIIPFGYLLSSGALAWGPAKQVITRTTERFAERIRYASGTPGRDGLDPAPSPATRPASSPGGVGEEAA
jgi:NADH-quinone oxidoreductase subunit A